MIKNILSYVNTLLWSCWMSLLDYLAAHVLLCLVPALVINEEVVGSGRRSRTNRVCFPGKYKGNKYHD